MKLLWLILLFPVSLFAQNKSADNFFGNTAQHYLFHTLKMDDFLTTSPDKGGSVKYNYDTTGMNIDGEIEVNVPKKYITIRYSADKKDIMKAMIEKGPIYDAVAGCYTFKGYWTDTKEKTEISIVATTPVKVIKVLFGPHKGDYSNYWDRIYNYSVVVRN